MTEVLIILDYIWIISPTTQLWYESQDFGMLDSAVLVLLYGAIPGWH